jgi:M6 family metalloprotease-like protein
MKKIIFILLFALPILLQAAPYHGQIKSFKQPDGTTVDVKLFGNEYYMRAEGLDGYTLIRDKKTNWICYATLSSDESELISTGIIYKGKKDDLLSFNKSLSISKHIDISKKSIDQTILENQKRLGISHQQDNAKTNYHSVIGSIKGLCIVVDFSDEVGTLPISEFTDFCNNLTYNHNGNNGSLRTFYSDISGGLLDYQNVVYGYYRAPKTFAQYEAMPYAQGAQEILGLTLNWIESLGFDFSTLTTNSDGSIEAINLMYTGQAQNWAQGMWWHQGDYPYFTADGVHSGAYNCSPANDPLTLGTVCHENGHMIGKWPDTYKYDGSSDGLGDFDLMCYGGDSYNPVPPNPHFWSNAGWGKLVDVTFYNGLNSDTANNLTCYKYINQNDTNEFFLIENMRQTGRTASIPDEGLTIWHIDRMGDNQTTHNEVYLVHANNNSDNHNDACFHSGFNTDYGLATTPNSAFFNGNPSGLRVWSIGPIANIISYKLGAGQAAPTFSLAYVNISGDNNTNGFLEPGESGNININASNFGQLNSGTATITCTAIANPGYITINTPTFNAGIINIAQTIPTAYNVTIAPATPLGTQITLKFLISDGTYSTYITKIFIVGYQVIMADLPVTTCSAIFYDNGGAFSNYTNITDHTMTLFPQSSSQKVRTVFSTFDLEDETNCGYDYLNIYNGPSTSSTSLGTFCGTNSPGTITSTDVTGALTFEFHSDEGVTGTGWSALISCTGTSNIENISNENNFEIYPNPSSGIFNLNINFDYSEISLTNVIGEEIFKNINQQVNQINLSDQANGLYFLKIKTNQEVLTRKIIISK